MFRETTFVERGMSEPFACFTQVLRDSPWLEVNARMAERELRDGVAALDANWLAPLPSRGVRCIRGVLAALLLATVGTGCARDDGTDSLADQRGPTRAATRPPVARPSAATCDGERAKLETAPAPASPGDRVPLRGNCFTGRYWKTLNPGDGYGIALVATVDDAGRPVNRTRQISCEVIAHARGRFHVSRDGRLRGWFVVPRNGVCFQQENDERPVREGKYSIVLGCHACAVGQLEIRS